MRELTFQQIGELDHGEIIPSFRAKIKIIYEQKSGEGEYGTWYLQNLIGTDGFDDIVITWTGADEFDGGTKGLVYKFECTEGRKGLVGIKRDKRRVNGKLYEGIKVNDASKITRSTLDGGSEQQQHESEDAFLSERHASPTRQQRAAPPSSVRNLGDSARDARREMNRQGETVMSKDDYWQRKEQRDIERDARYEAQQPRIERMHAQKCAVEVLSVNGEKMSRENLRRWTDYFVVDINRTQDMPKAEKPAQRAPDMQDADPHGQHGEVDAPPYSESEALR